MFGVQPADPVTFVLLQSNIATTTRVRDDRRHFFALPVNRERERREADMRERENGIGL